MDRIESLETTLSHLISEMTANVLVLAFILIYMFILGWRVALLSLSILPVGFVLILFTFRDYSENFQ
ncbi:ABC transporter transmembrane domain-containing protein [Blautia hydrogenotrophica]|uniref:ABC transporter transmembrane domain-containing protein n=1 Tax=Blautia hydrogenotrophica TaxID=53443 RepID=UPI0034DCE6DE